MEIEIKGFIVAYFSSYGDQTVPSHYSFMNWKPDSPEYVVLAEHPGARGGLADSPGDCARQGGGNRRGD